MVFNLFNCIMSKRKIETDNELYVNKDIVISNSPELQSKIEENTIEYSPNTRSSIKKIYQLIIL